MNRLEKKSVIAASAMHGLVALVLLFGAALMPRHEAPPIQHITLFDPRLVTDSPTSGGTPMVVQAPPQQPQAQPQAQPPVAEVRPAQVQPRPVPHRQPDPPRAVEPVQKVKAPSLRPSDMQMVKRTTATTSTTATSTKTVKKSVEDDSAQEAAAAAAAQRKRVNNAVNSALNSLSDDSPDARPINIAPGIGGGPLMANYRDIVASKYLAAWNPPPGIEDESATVQVRIVISRDGQVIRHEIIKSSGNAAIDRSIQSTLERVTFIAPFPAGSSDSQRVFPLNFNLAAKRMMG